MNAFGNEPERGGDGDGPPIILLSFERRHYFMYRGDEFMDQILLVGGEFPKPVLCVHFENMFEAKQILGMDFTTASHWGIHPDIIERLRTEGALVETDA